MSETNVKVEKKNNVLKEAYGFWKNCVFGTKTRELDGGVTIRKESTKNYSKVKVALGTGLFVLGGTAAAIGSVVGIEALRNRNNVDDDILLSDDGSTDEVEVTEI